jgi:predicted ATPase
MTGTVNNKTAIVVNVASCDNNHDKDDTDQCADPVVVSSQSQTHNLNNLTDVYNNSCSKTDIASGYDKRDGDVRDEPHFRQKVMLPNDVANCTVGITTATTPGSSTMVRKAATTNPDKKLSPTSSSFTIDTDDTTVGTATTITNDSSSTSTSNLAGSSTPGTAATSPQLQEENEENVVVHREGRAPSRFKVAANAIYAIRDKEIDSIIQCYHRTMSSPHADCTSSSAWRENRTTALIPDSQLPTMPSSKTRDYHSKSSSSSIGARKLSRTITASTSTTNTTPADRTVSSSFSVSTFLIVTGPIGSGKTTLIQHVFQNLLFHQPRRPDDSVISTSTTSPMKVNGGSECTDGFLIRGTFDRLQHSDPYRAYCMALTDFTHQVIQRGSDTIQTMQHAIRDACQNETPVLIQMIPALSAIIDYSSPDSAKDNAIEGELLKAKHMVSNPLPSNSPVVVAEDAIQRFVFVFQTFLRAISSLEQPVVLVLEDMQYADPCSVDILCRIMTDIQHLPGLMVMGTYNTTDDYTLFPTQSSSIRPILDPDHSDTKPTKVSIAANHYFVEKVSEMERSSHGLIGIQSVHVPDLNIEQVQSILGETLQQCAQFELQVDTELCEVVMEETEGNLYRLVEFIHWIHDQQLITTRCPPNCNSSFPYSTWDVEEIRQAVRTSLETSVRGSPNISSHRSYAANKFENLPSDLMEVLKVGACFGDSHMEDKLMECVLDFPIASVLVEAVESGLLVELYNLGTEGKQYAFAHENLTRYVYNLISEDSRELYHLEIGRRLWRQSDRNELDRSIFVVLSQIYLGRRLITRSTELYNIATLCLRAGRKAAKSSTFRVSLTYLNFGIVLLGERGWRDEYNLTLMIYNAAAEMEVCTSNYEGMELLVAEIVKNSRCIEDKIQARTTQVYAYGINDRQHESLDLGIQLLAEIGYPFPKHFCSRTMRSEVKTVLSLLKGKSNEYLKRLPTMEDAKVLAAMQVLNILSPQSLFLSNILSYR